LSVLSGIVDFIKLLILNSHLINAIEISELFDCGHYGELRATYCFLTQKSPLYDSGLFRDSLKSIRRLEMTYSFIPEGDAWAYSTNCCHVLANNKLYTLNCRRKKARYVSNGLFCDSCKSIRRLEMTYSFIPEGDAWAYSTNSCHVLANNKLYTINCRRKKARYVSNGLITTLSSQFSAWK
jgi:hypothetical protein